jgi:hypothetical protein
LVGEGTTMKVKERIALGLILLAAVGCGSSAASPDGGGHGGSGGVTGGGGGKGGNGGSGPCQPIIPGDGTATWDHNGSPQCGTITIAQHVTSASQDFFEFVGASENNGYGIGITVVSYTSTPLGGTYHCKNDAGIGALYVNFVYSTTVSDCTITIDNPGAPGGAHATGSFSLTGTGSDGGTIDVTNGVFDTPVMVLGG